MVLPFSRALLLSTSVAALYAGAGAADAYAVGGNAPEFVADFAGVLNSGTEYYRSGGSDTTFNSVFTHSGLVAPATMTDSDGVLKWAPHNLITVDSEQLTGLFGSNVSVTNNDTTAPNGTTTASRFTSTATATNKVGQAFGYNWESAANVTGAVYLKAGTCRYVGLGDSSGPPYVIFDLQLGTVHATSGTTNETITSVGDGWYRCTFRPAGAGSFLCIFGDSDGTSTGWTGSSVTSGEYYWAWGVHLYRSDLGGMVDNPDQTDSNLAKYVPTTTAARFLPRRNNYIYNGTSWEKAGILIESAAATNLLPYSNDFGNAEWAKTGITATNTGDSPLGTGTAWKIASSTASSALHYLRDAAVPTTNGAKYTLSVFAKADELDYVALSFSNDFIEVWFNLSTGSVGTVEAGAANARIESFGNGWYRCSVTFTADGATEDVSIYATQADAQIIETLSIGDGIFVAGAQLEEGSTPTSYIPTSGSTVTRAAETLTAAGSSLPANTTGVSVQMQGRMTYADLGTEAQRTFWRWYNGASDFLLCDLDTDGADTGEVNANQSDTTGGAGTVAIDAYSPGINVAYNIASRHSNTDINLAVDGTAGTADATPTALHDASSDTFQVAHNLQSTVGMLRVWGDGLSDTNLESAT